MEDAIHLDDDRLIHIVAYEFEVRIAHQPPYIFTGTCKKIIEADDVMPLAQ